MTFTLESQSESDLLLFLTVLRTCRMVEPDDGEDCGGGGGDGGMAAW